MFGLYITGAVLVFIWLLGILASEIRGAVANTAVLSSLFYLFLMIFGALHL